MMLNYIDPFINELRCEKHLMMSLSYNILAEQGFLSPDVYTRAICS